MSDLWNWSGPPYRHIDTGGGDDTPDGGLMARKHPQQSITNYINVESVTQSMTKLEKLGGKVCMPRTAVPQVGYFAVCQDTGSNINHLFPHGRQAPGVILARGTRLRVSAGRIPLHRLLARFAPSAQRSHCRPEQAPGRNPRVFHVLRKLMVDFALRGAIVLQLPKLTGKHLSTTRQPA